MIYNVTKRYFDFASAFTAMVLLLPLCVAISLVVKITGSGPVFYWSNRVGKNNKIFRMPKFRTMKVETPVVATHLLNEAQSYVTPIGRFLRKTSLDELPQLWSILKGDMSFVGPRPALFNQDDLVKLRTEHGIDELVPGLTGLAQINGRDDLPIPDKVRFESKYLHCRSFWFDLYIICKTVIKILKPEGVSH